MPAVYFRAVLWSSMNSALASILFALAMLPNAFVKAGDLFADNAVEEVDDGAAVEFGAGLVRIVQNIFLFFQKKLDLV